MILFSTDKDASKVTIAAYNADSGGLFFNQDSSSADNFLSDNNFIGFDSANYLIMAGVGADGKGDPVFYAYSYPLTSGWLGRSGGT